jgi:hypothetical protein
MEVIAVEAPAAVRADGRALPATAAVRAALAATTASAALHEDQPGVIVLA